MTAFYLFEEQIPVLEPFSLQYYQQYITEWTSNRVVEDQHRAPAALLRSSKGTTSTAPVPSTTPLTSTEPADLHAAPLTQRRPHPPPPAPLALPALPALPAVTTA